MTSRLAGGRPHCAYPPGSPVLRSRMRATSSKLLGRSRRNPTARRPENCTCRDTWAPCGRRRRRPAAGGGFRWLAFKTTAAALRRSRLERHRTGAKATCDRLALFGRHGVFDGDGRWPARLFSSDSPSLAVDIIRRHIAVSLLRRRPCVRPFVCAQMQRGDVAAGTTRALHMSKSACAQCTSCFVPHARHAMMFC
jgi:hypothetical protein